MNFHSFKTISDFENKLNEDFFFEKIKDPIEFVKTNAIHNQLDFIDNNKEEIIINLSDAMIPDWEFYAAYILIKPKNSLHEILRPERGARRSHWNHTWKYPFILVGSIDGIEFTMYFFMGEIRGIFDLL